MNGYLIPLTCNRCGGTLEHAATGEVRGGRETVAAASCAVCHSRWLLRVVLTHVPDGRSERRTAQSGGVLA